MHYALVKIRIGKHLKYISLFIILLKQYNPLISWVKETLKFYITYY